MGGFKGVSDRPSAGRGRGAIGAMVGGKRSGFANERAFSEPTTPSSSSSSTPHDNAREINLEINLSERGMIHTKARK